MSWFKSQEFHCRIVEVEHGDDGDRQHDSTFEPSMRLEAQRHQGFDLSGASDPQDGQDLVLKPRAHSRPALSKKHASPEDWQKHKAEIRRLYLDEKRKLDDVMKIMFRDHEHYGR